jgi:uncharacterized protein (TIGR02646 family)
MIQIDKSAHSAPDVLTTRGATATEQHKLDYLAGTRKFSFENSVYGHSSVKALLIKIQHDKCCFCERKISAGEPGHIEHYRPKGGYKIQEKSKLVKPGYYWLAYDFGNLFLSCNRCNTSYKKNYFPLVDETKRAINHDLTIEDEDPLILNPSIDPSPHLVFSKEILMPKNKSEKGKETINRTGLNRKALADERLSYLKVLEILAVVARGGGPESINARNHFIELGKKESVYSYMVNCNFPDLV